MPADGADPAPAEPVLLRRATPWGVRLTLNRPAKLNALSGAARRGPRRRDRRGRRRPGGPGHRPRGRRSGVLVGLRPDRGDRRRDRRSGRLARASRRGRCGDAARPRLPQAGHRPGPWLRAGRRARAGDGLRPGRRRRGNQARRARDPLRVRPGHVADAVPDRPEEDPRAVADGRPRSTRSRPNGSG